MIERLLITLLISTLAVLAYRLFITYQRERATLVSQAIGNHHHPRLLYFGSQTCGACIAQGHYLAKLEAPFRAMVEAIDVEKMPHLAQQYGIMTLPTTILIDGTGKVRHINPGLTNPFKLTRQLEDLTTSAPGRSFP